MVVPPDIAEQVEKLLGIKVVEEIEAMTRKLSSETTQMGVKSAVRASKDSDLVVEDQPGVLCTIQMGNGQQEDMAIPYFDLNELMPDQSPSLMDQLSAIRANYGSLAEMNPRRTTGNMEVREEGVFKALVRMGLWKGDGWVHRS